MGRYGTRMVGFRLLRRWRFTAELIRHSSFHDCATVVCVIGPLQIIVVNLDSRLSLAEQIAFRQWELKECGHGGLQGLAETQRGARKLTGAA